MEELEQINEREFTIGFNHAMVLAGARPELFEDIVQSVNPNNSYFDGFFSGKEQYELEETTRQLDELDNLREESNDRDEDFDRDF